MLETLLFAGLAKVAAKSKGYPLLVGLEHPLDRTWLGGDLNKKEYGACDTGDLAMS
jgi:hypothetical protein